MCLSVRRTGAERKEKRINVCEHEEEEEEREEVDKLIMEKKTSA